MVRRQPRDYRLDRFLQVVVDDDNNDQAVQIVVAPVLQLHVNHPLATNFPLVLVTGIQGVNSDSADSEEECDVVIPEETVFCKPTTM